MDNENSVKNLDNTGLVILYGRELESSLRKLGATGMGAGELANSIKQDLPQSLFRDICYMIKVRNHFAHAGDSDGDDPSEDFDPGDYKEFAEGVIRRLKRLAISNPPPVEKKPQAEKKSSVKSVTRELSPEEIEFINFKAEIKRRIQIFGCLPLFNWFYFFMLFCSAFKKAMVPLFIILLSLLSVPPFINGFATCDEVHITCGIALAAAGYIWAITNFNNILPKPAWFWWLPFCHIVRIFGQLGQLTDWKRLIFGTIGIALNAAAVTMLFIQEHPWKYFFIYAITAFCLSLGHLIFFAQGERENS